MFIIQDSGQAFDDLQLRIDFWRQVAVLVWINVNLPNDTEMRQQLSMGDEGSRQMFVGKKNLELTSEECEQHCVLNLFSLEAAHYWLLTFMVRSLESSNSAATSASIVNWIRWNGPAKLQNLFTPLEKVIVLEYLRLRAFQRALLVDRSSIPDENLAKATEVIERLLID